MDNPFIREQFYDAPIEQVWQALTEQDKMREWYFPHLKSFQPVVGSKFEFNNDGSNFQKEWTVIKVVAGKLLAHSWIYKGYPGSSEVTFELFNKDSGTMLKLTHAGISSFPAEPHFARLRFENGWNDILRIKLNNFLKK